MEKNSKEILKDLINNLNYTTKLFIINDELKRIGFEKFILGSGRYGIKLTSLDFKKDYISIENIFEIEKEFDMMDNKEDCEEYFYKYCDEILNTYKHNN